MSRLTQTRALFVDAYRELNARRMFWITLILSAVVIGSFAFVGVSPAGLRVFGATFDVPSPMFVYKTVFSVILIGIWAKWGALVLALISTASIFPDLISGGTIDVYLSKPLGRLRLFLTKYAGGLLFVLLQTTVFAVASYLIFGWRGGEWRPSLFLMIPLIVLLYSYLFCVCVLVGVLTRSTVAAILVTVLFWLICFGINLADGGLFNAKVLFSAQARGYEQEVRRLDEQIRRSKDQPSVLNAFGIRESRLKAQRERARLAAENSKQTADKVAMFYRIAHGVASIVPKTGETVDLLDRKLFTDADMVAAKRDQADDNSKFFAEPMEQSEGARAPTTNPAEEMARVEEDAHAREARRRISEDAMEEATRAARSRSIPWILGTSVGFEAVILAWGAWVFCRRDY